MGERGGVKGSADLEKWRAVQAPLAEVIGTGGNWDSKTTKKQGGTFFSFFLFIGRISSQ